MPGRKPHPFHDLKKMLYRTLHMDKWAELFEEKAIFSWSFHRVDITAI